MLLARQARLGSGTVPDEWRPTFEDIEDTRGRADLLMKVLREHGADSNRRGPARNPSGLTLVYLKLYSGDSALAVQAEAMLVSGSSATPRTDSKLRAPGTPDALARPRTLTLRSANQTAAHDVDGPQSDTRLYRSFEYERVRKAKNRASIPASRHSDRAASARSSLSGQHSR